MTLEKSLTTSSKGRREIRTLVERGVYAIVEYRDPETLELVEKKFKVYLKDEKGELKGFLLIPMKKGRDRFLALEDRSPKKDLYAYNMESGIEEQLFK
jgi:hypothetical protein